jgi:hypothetical protein
LHMVPFLSSYYLKTSKTFNIEFIVKDAVSRLNPNDAEIIRKLIKNAIVNYNKIDSNKTCVKLYPLNAESPKSSTNKLIQYQVLVNSPFEVVTDDDFQNALAQYAESKVRCSIVQKEGETVSIVCNPLADDGLDYFFKFDNQWLRFVPAAAQNATAVTVQSVQSIESLTPEMAHVNNFTALSDDNADEVKTVFSLKNIRNYLHTVPFMGAFYYKNIKTFNIDLIIDCNVLNLSKNHTKLVQESIKNAIVNYKNVDQETVCVQLNPIDTNYLTSHVEKLIHYQVTVNSHLNAVSDDDFQNALIQYSENKVKCALNKTSGVTITCYPHVEKDLQSLLKLDSHWFQLVPPPAPISSKVVMNELFTYQPAWIIGLSVIGVIIGVFFFGCIIAICYTRRPYKRSSKIYELDFSTKSNKRTKYTPQIPTIQPSTRTSLQTKKELLYQ